MQHDNILDDFDFDDSPFFEENSGEVVAKFYSALEADVAAARLRAEGIPCFIANSSAHSVLPHLQVLLRLHVRSEDSLRARALLAEAAIDAEMPHHGGRDKQVLTILAVLIGVLLAILLVRAMWGIY